MNGRYLLDTNAVINLLKKDDLAFKPEESNSVFFVSIITEIELLAYKDITPEEEEAIKNLLPQTGILNISEDIKNRTIELKKKKSIKIPDAVICATAMSKELTLVTDDQDLFNISGVLTIHLDDLVLSEQSKNYEPQDQG